MRLATIAATALLLALAGAGQPWAQQKQLVPLKVGTLKQAALTDVWVAKQAGLFEKNGLDVGLTEFRSGNEAIAAQRGGHVDIVLSIPGTAMTANERGFDLVLLAQNETAKKEGPDAGSLVVLNDSGSTTSPVSPGKRSRSPTCTVNITLPCR